MKSIMLLSVVATLLLGACANRHREVQIEIPPHNTPAPTHGQTPTQQ